MRNRLTKIALLGALVATSISATDYRSPYLSERGPIRYRFEKWSNKWSLDVWGAGHYREAHKAFISHGTNTHPLTALIFNKADFPLVEAFPDKKMPTNSVNYNPFIAYNLTTLSPRVTYYEYGADLGASWKYPVWKNKGSIGLRGRIPFKNIEMERENITDKNSDPKDKVVLTRYTNIKTGGTETGNQAPRYVKAYNLGFVTKLVQSDGSPAVAVTDKSVKVMGSEITGNLSSADNKVKMATNIKAPMGIIYNATNSNFPADPLVKDSNDYGNLTDKYWGFNRENDVDQIGSTNIDYNGVLSAHQIATQGTPAPTMDKYAVAPGIGFFNNNTTSGVNYSTLITDNDTNLNKMWLVSGYESGELTADAKTVVDGIEAAINQYNLNPYEWLLKYGNYEMETHQRTGLGDIDLDLFYNHHFSNKWIGEVFFGVTFPSGSGDDYYGNPYRAQLGNGEHFVLKIGGYIAWQPLGWMNIKLDLKGGFALEATEHRMAAFKGAAIKNMGPKVDADVDWQYFVGCLDFTLFHPKDHNLACDIGYEFFYKTEDNIKFKQSQATPWYGDKIDGTSNASDLDNGLMEKNTESIGHKVRYEASWKTSKYLDLCVGGAYTFAGKDIPREKEIHATGIVRF